MSPGDTGHRGAQALDDLGMGRIADQRGGDIGSDGGGGTPLASGSRRSRANSARSSACIAVEPHVGVAQGQRLDAGRMPLVKVGGDRRPHRQADDMQPFDAEMIENAQQVGVEIVEIERPFIIVRAAIAARIPGHHPEIRGEVAQVVLPVRPVAADAVQENNGVAPPGDIDRDAGRGPTRTVWTVAPVPSPGGASRCREPLAISVIRRPPSFRKWCNRRRFCVYVIVIPFC